MVFTKGELVWFDAGNGHEAGKIIAVDHVAITSSGKKSSVTVMLTDVPTGAQARMIRVEDLSRVKKRNGLNRASIPNEDHVPDAGSGRQWIDEEMGINDMIQLSELNEDSILQNLKLRFSHNVIYTSIGSILVAVNPYRMFPEMYNRDSVKLYENYHRLPDLPPHLFAIGSAALYQMNKEHEDQVVIISGESGAGKTESTKLIMQFLAAVNQSKSNLVSEQILEANPLLESFGNAKTIRNDNSSRFGKYLAIYFSREGVITGAKITEYLLEKSRICTHAEDERNYHVFYELLAGLTKEEKVAYGLQEEKSYYYLNQGGDSKLPAKNDAEDFQALKSAMQVLNFTPAECETVFKILAAVLHIGNIRFKVKPVEYQAEGVVVERESEVRWMAHLLQIPDSGIVSALTTKTTEARNEKLLTPLNSDQAFDARDAIAKALYSRLFTWLVDRTNQIVAQNQNRNTSIALLDIFGFEDFKENSFEQLCINYANETLQFYFNQHVFNLEQQEYAKEKITWSQIEFVDNQPVLDLIAKKPVGILHILDDESSFPKATDGSFLEKCHYNHGTNSLYQRPKTLQSSFAVRHYAGQVSYNVNGFLDKNRDTLRADVIELFIGSGVLMVSKMFQEWKDSSDFVKTVKRGAGRFVTMKPRTPTVSARFQESLGLLVETMSKCRPHFVRCVKPNRSKAPTTFESTLVLDQLKYTGMLETIRIRKVGYPIRLKFSHFLTRYRCLLRLRKIPTGTQPKELCQSILDAFYQLRNIQPSTSFKSKLLPDFQLGTSKVFLREAFHNKLEQERDKILAEAATVIQRNIRGHLQRQQYYLQKNAVVKIQSTYRGYQQRKKYTQIKKGIIQAQAAVRMQQERKRYLDTVDKAKDIEVQEAPKRLKEQKIRQDNRAQAAASNVKNPQIPAEMSFIFNKLDEWQAPHTDRHIVKVVGHLTVDSLKGKPRFELPRDIDAHPFQKYAGIYCKNRTWGHRRDPISEPFLTNLTADEKQEALEIFRLILRFTHDNTLGEKKEKVLADYIVHKGLIHADRLRDEIYCQLCNQTWPPELLNNTTVSSTSSVSTSFDMASVERGWCLMASCLSAFPPSQILYKYLLKYISDYAIDNFKFTCQSKLLQCSAIDSSQSRVYPPTLLEMKTSRKNALMAMNVSFPDGDSRAGPVTSWTTAAEFAKNLLRQRDVISEANGWTVMLVDDHRDRLVELNGSDYILDVISEMELPSSFPSLKPAFLLHRSRDSKRRGDGESYVGKMDFDDEDENGESVSGGPSNRNHRPGKPVDQKVTRLGLAKHSKLNQRYELDKQDLAKTSALNKRYLLTEADVALNVASSHDKSIEHPGLSQSNLNERYRSGQSVLSEPESIVSNGKGGDHQRRAQSAASDAQSMTSHVRKVLVPTSSNPKEISAYVDEIFDSVLGIEVYEDDDEPVTRLDVKKLAASIKGGGSKQTKLPNEPAAFRGSTANLSQPAPYPYGQPVPPVLSAAQYGLPLGGPMSAAGLPPLGYFPQLPLGDGHHLPYQNPFFYVPTLSHARSTESVLSDPTGHRGPPHVMPSHLHGFPHPAYYPPAPRSVAGGYKRSNSSGTPEYAYPFGQGQGYPPVVVPAHAGPVVDPVFQHYLQQQNVATQIHLQHQLANALHQNYELQQKLLQNQHEMGLSARGLHNHRTGGGGSDGNNSGSPDSLPPTPTGLEENFLFDHKGSHHHGRSNTPLPTTSVRKYDPEPVLPPRKYELPPRTAKTGPPPPPPPPPPAVKPHTALSEPGKPGRLEIAGRARTIRVGRILWPPRLETPSTDVEYVEPHKTTNLSQLGKVPVLPGSTVVAPPVVPEKVRSTPPVYSTPAVKAPEVPRNITPNRLVMDAGVRNLLENTLGGHAGKTAAAKVKAPEKKNFLPAPPVMPVLKPIFDANGIPKAPPPPPGTVVVEVNPNPPLPVRNHPPVVVQGFHHGAKQQHHPVEVHPLPKTLSPMASATNSTETVKKAAMDSPAGSSYYAYNRTHWSMTMRKEFFTPAEKVDNPLATNLIFAQICNDVFHEYCVRMTRDEQEHLRSLFGSYGISDLESASQPEKLKGQVKKIVIDAARELPLYFCRLYPVAVDNDGGTAFRRQFIGMSHSGLRLVRLEKDSSEDQENLTVGEHRRFEEVLETNIIRPSTLEIVFVQPNTGPSSKKNNWVFHTHKAVQIKALIDQMSAEADQISGGGGMGGEFVRAVADYRTKDPTLLSFRRDDIIKLAMRNQSYLDKGWLYGNIGERWGIFPCEYVVALSRQEAYQVKSKLPQSSTGQAPKTFTVPDTKKMTNGSGDISYASRERHPGTNSSSSSQRSDSSERGIAATRANDGRLSMVEFAMFNFRQSIEKYGVVNPIRRDSNASSMQGSIKQIEKLKDATGKEWTWKEQAEMVKFSRSPIQHSLLKFDNADLDKVAVEAFLSLMRFMTDYPMSKNQNEVESVYMVLMVCHKYPMLRDEVYCQIIKQTTNNKSAKPESCQRGWRFFSIVAAYFDCTEVLRPYIFKYLETAAYDKRRPYHGTALVCLQNLRKTFKYGGRKNVPSVDEIAAITAGRSSKRQIYLLPGGMEKIINTKSSTVVEDVILELCNQLRIDSMSEADEYSVYAMRDKEDMYGVPLQYEDYVLDITTELLKSSDNFLLLFRRSVWYSPLRLSDPSSNAAYIEMIFHQVVPDYLDGLLLVLPAGGLVDEEVREVGKIAALLHRSTDKQQPPDVKEVKYLLPKPALSVRDPRPPQWLQIVQDYFQATIKLTPIEAKAKFLEKLEKWTLFGSSFFFVSKVVTPVAETSSGHSYPSSSGSSAESSARRQPETSLMNYILAINKKGVFFLDVDSRETVIHHSFSDIISTRRVPVNGALYLDMKCGNLLSQRITRMQTPQAHEIARLIGHYIHIENSVLASKAARSNLAVELQQSEAATEED
ncbi:Unconventional myosin-XV [Hypsibius exemplaris]|uniref:Unconventional myosin-XV n=1 Tax=Hypsibius exemplaris TaxID=2072580 RepID=A0A1W0XC35_HYPEX|nr:Unconventional myosin-XV [Hypsibius exemplaris]